MKLSSVVKVISIFSYFFIILQGDMTAIPYGFWLILSLFDFSSIGPLFAIMAFSGGVIACRTKRQDKLYMIRILAAFLLLLSPLIWRLSVVPLKLFNYTAFIFPLVVFVVFFFVAWAIDACKSTLKLQCTESS
jgi:hypothetical protein